EAFSSDSRIKAKIIDHGDGVFRRSSTSNASCLQHPSCNKLGMILRNNCRGGLLRGISRYCERDDFEEWMIWVKRALCQEQLPNVCTDKSKYQTFDFLIHFHCSHFQSHGLIWLNIVGV
ncbi:hypothetical protein MKW98_004679, partial [Papaver atlanticum]